MYIFKRVLTCYFNKGESFLRLMRSTRALVEIVISLVRCVALNQRRMRPGLEMTYNSLDALKHPAQFIICNQ